MSDDAVNLSKRLFLHNWLIEQNLLLQLGTHIPITGCPMPESSLRTLSTIAIEDSIASIPRQIQVMYRRQQVHSDLETSGYLNHSYEESLEPNMVPNDARSRSSRSLTSSESPTNNDCRVLPSNSGPGRPTLKSSSSHHRDENASHNFNRPITRYRQNCRRSVNSHVRSTAKLHLSSSTEALDLSRSTASQDRTRPTAEVDHTRSTTELGHTRSTTGLVHTLSTTGFKSFKTE